jgi:hypothetical protein
LGDGSSERVVRLRAEVHAIDAVGVDDRAGGEERNVLPAGHRPVLRGEALGLGEATGEEIAKRGGVTERPRRDQQDLRRRIRVPTGTTELAAVLDDAHQLPCARGDPVGAAMEVRLGLVGAEHDHDRVQRQMRPEDCRKR